jgi:pentatricopeptide repeat protein
MAEMNDKQMLLDGFLLRFREAEKHYEEALEAFNQASKDYKRGFLDEEQHDLANQTMIDAYAKMENVSAAYRMIDNLIINNEKPQ